MLTRGDVQEEVDAAFDAFKELKFSQRLQLRGKGQGISVMPLPAGHLLGGSMWRIATEAVSVVNLQPVAMSHPADCCCCSPRTKLYMPCISTTPKTAT